mmetsp:Transcript_87803/g.131674  ORF Transcript_87803/g.131674 Transcript_87803/m.131674 type:complete len:84 (+) Transcript_87803:184-435(+)
MELQGWAENNFLLDGYPRDTENIAAWDNVMKDGETSLVDVPFALNLQCSFDTMAKRILKRASESEVKRDDDNIETLKKRFETY